jgi:hypothetical protein
MAGKVRLGGDRLGSARQGLDRSGTAWQARLGKGWFGEAW